MNCGICTCDPLHFGQICECSVNEVASNNDTKGCRPDNVTTIDCSGRGTCSCGRCNCLQEGVSTRTCTFHTYYTFVFTLFVHSRFTALIANVTTFHVTGTTDSYALDQIMALASADSANANTDGQENLVTVVPLQTVAFLQVFIVFMFVYKYFHI